MAETVVCYLTAKNHLITIASNILKDAEEIAKKFNNCSALSLDVTNQVKNTKKNEIILNFQGKIKRYYQRTSYCDQLCASFPTYSRGQSVLIREN